MIEPIMFIGIGFLVAAGLCGLRRQGAEPPADQRDSEGNGSQNCAHRVLHECSGRINPALMRIS